MPFVSKAQSRLAHAAENDPEVAARTGFSQAAAKKFVADSRGQSLKSLPEHVSKNAEGGAVETHQRGTPFTMPGRKFRW